MKTLHFFDPKCVLTIGSHYTPRDSNFREKAIPYFVKQISLDRSWPDPESYVPREFDDYPVDDEGRYLNPHTKIMALPNLMTVEELREHIPLSKSTIYKLVEERKIPHITIDRRILFDPSIVAEWLRIRTVDTTTIGNSPDERNLTNLQSNNLDVSMCSKPNENLMKDVDRILKSPIIENK
jgi:excisionase family DNA binding protein